MSEKETNKFKKKGGGGSGKFFQRKSNGGNFGAATPKGDAMPLTNPKG